MFRSCSISTIKFKNQSQWNCLEIMKKSGIFQVSFQLAASLTDNIF